MAERTNEARARERENEIKKWMLQFDICHCRQVNNVYVVEANCRASRARTDERMSN